MTAANLKLAEVHMETGMQDIYDYDYLDGHLDNEHSVNDNNVQDSDSDIQAQIDDNETSCNTSIIDNAQLNAVYRRQSSFSVQAICKVLCALNNVTYSPVFRTQMSIAFDMYLDLLRRVEHLVNTALGRTTPQWHLQHACPPCSYNLENEVHLIPSGIQAMDGNQSMKRMPLAAADNRTFTSDYDIGNENVDLFKDDVKRSCRSAKGKHKLGDSDSPFDDDEVICSNNWKASHAISEDTIRVFDQIGIYISACHHGLVQTYAEMHQSGELAKYGLATLNHLLTNFGDDLLVGCDIACSFTSTVNNSSLSKWAHQCHLQLLLNSFHGYAHERKCQLVYHPMYHTSVGLEDMETCERVFSASNSVARGVHHASHFHWGQFLDLHFQQWDEDKYLELSNFLYNNYKQALKIINDVTPVIEAYKSSTGYTSVIIEMWHSEEAAFLAKATKESSEDTLCVAYVPETLTPVGTLKLVDHAHILATEKDRRKIICELHLAENTASDLEYCLGLVERWVDTDSEYVETLNYINNCTFIRIVEKLESLTINNTLKKYNELAPKQTPPRPQLSKADITRYAWLSDFELLKHAREDILHKPWTNPLNREMAAKHYKLKAAHEEIICLNVEIQRLATWVDDEDNLLLRVMENLQSEDPQLAYLILQMKLRRQRINNVHRVHLHAIYALPGYTGYKTPGRTRL
ncbi:hypothetical protein BU17DRAFT_73909 [Hysterangium stoloniferum]|nr:hypothetical protein BU17DRAFT_73909 [Hysterangium stoloniferum]